VHRLIRSKPGERGSPGRLDGTGITAQRNTIHDTRRGGIACITCTDSTITGNTVQHVATAGIYISGQRITVNDNTVSDTVAVEDGDADGMRFFGTGHRITGSPATRFATYPTVATGLRRTPTVSKHSTTTRPLMTSSSRATPARTSTRNA
jgi:parallel beta-helix repeat protein